MRTNSKNSIDAIAQLYSEATGTSLFQISTAIKWAFDQGIITDAERIGYTIGTLYNSDPIRVKLRNHPVRPMREGVTNPHWL